MFGEFVAEGFFAFGAVGFFEGGNVEPALGGFAFSDLGAAVGDEAVDQGDVRAHLFAFDNIGARGVAGHKDVCFHPGPGRVGGECAGGVAGGGHGEFFEAELFGH